MQSVGPILAKDFNLLKFRFALAVSAALLVSACASMNQTKSAATPPLARKLADAKKMMAAQDWTHAEPALRDIAGSKAFTSLSADDQRRVLENLVNTAAKLHRQADAAAALSTLVRRWPDRIAELDEHFTLQFLAESRQLPHDTLLPLLQALYDAHWKLKWGIEPSTAWRDLALMLLEKGQLNEAVDVSAARGAELEGWLRHFLACFEVT